MKEQWGKFTARIDSMSLRERVLIFLAAAFLLIAMVNSLFLDPLLAQQKSLSEQVGQQHEKIREKQAEIEALLMAQKNDQSSPLRQRLKTAAQQLAEGNAWLQGNSQRLVQPEQMADLLEQVLRKNNMLRLVRLQTLPATPLIERPAQSDGNAASASAELEKQEIFKHGVKITVIGGYASLLQYLSALERLPVKMFWGMADMKVVKYPDAELTLTLYTLSLDKTWLQI